MQVRLLKTAACVTVCALAGAMGAHAQTPTEPTEPTQSEEPAFAKAARSVHEQLETSLAELAALREKMAAEMIPLSRRLSDLEAELSQVRSEYQDTTLALDKSTLDLSNLGSDIKRDTEEGTYLSNLLNEYLRNFESRLHIAEVQRYEGVIEAAKLGLEDKSLSAGELYSRQAALLSAALERLHDALGGTRFEGTAVDPNGIVDEGSFVLVGPVALFRSADGQDVGTAEQRLGSLEPTVIPFVLPEDLQAAEQLITTSKGRIPLDPTLGNAHKIETTRETLQEHIVRGGPVMIPILALAAIALLITLFKWLSLAFLRNPSKKKIQSLLDAIAAHDESLAKERASELRGPVGKMLAVGVEHLGEPRELVEEVMYETVLTTRLKVQRFLPFIAICASSAPLLGLLGTVTGIINTFKMITVFGSGDVKSLSGGISEALITTEYGLIVAIPALLLHSFLSRKARGVVGEMEAAGVAFMNQLGKTPFGNEGGDSGGGGVLMPNPEHVKLQVREALGEVLGSLSKEKLGDLARKHASQPA